MATPIGTLGTIPTLTVGGRVFTDLTTLIILAGYQGSNARTTLRVPGASSGYPVTTGKTLTVHAARFSCSNTPGTQGYITQLVQSDNDLGYDSNTSYTNPKYYTAIANILFNGINNLPPPDKYEIAGLGFTVAATKYLSATLTASTTVWAYGYET